MHQSLGFHLKVRLSVSFGSFHFIFEPFVGFRPGDFMLTFVFGEFIFDAVWYFVSPRFTFHLFSFDFILLPFRFSFWFGSFYFIFEPFCWIPAWRLYLDLLFSASSFLTPFCILFRLAFNFICFHLISFCSRSVSRLHLVRFILFLIEIHHAISRCAPHRSLTNKHWIHRQFTVQEIEVHTLDTLLK